MKDTHSGTPGLNVGLFTPAGTPWARALSSRASAPKMSDAPPKPKPGPRVVRRVCANKPSASSSGGTSSGAGAQCNANPAACVGGGASKGGSWSQATATPQSWAPPAAKADPVDEELERVLKESLRMENARQETVATQVGARVEGNAIVPPDVGERAPLGSLPPPAGVGGALWEAKLRWLERTYGSMSSVRGATACGECCLGGYCHGSPYPGRPGLTLPDLGCATHAARATAPPRAQWKAAVRSCGRSRRARRPSRHAGGGNCFYRYRYRYR